MLVFVVASVAVAGGCGGDDGDGGQAQRSQQPTATALPGTELELTAPRRGSGEFRFDKRRLRADAGVIALRLVNNDEHQHNVRIHAGDTCCFKEGWKDLGGTPTISRGEPPTSATIELGPGTYIFLCDITGHWSERMWGRLTVQ
jgi:plastocyanin